MRLANGGDERSDPHVQLVERPPHGRCERDPRSRLPRARPLERVAQIAMAELDGSGEIGVAWSRKRDFVPALVGRLDRHARRPRLRVIRILDEDRERCAHGHAVAHSREDAGQLGLDLHPPAAAVAELSALQVAGDVLDEEPHAGGHSVEDADQRGAVRFTGGEEAEPAHDSAASRREEKRSSSPVRPSQISSEAIAWWTSTSMPSTARSPRLRALRKSSVSPPGRR